MLRGESRADFEQRLPGSLAQLVEDRPPRRIGQCLEHVSHRKTIGKYLLACQGPPRLCCASATRRFRYFRGMATLALTEHGWQVEGNGMDWAHCVKGGSLVYVRGSGHSRTGESRSVGVTSLGSRRRAAWLCWRRGSVWRAGNHRAPQISSAGAVSGPPALPVLTVALRSISRSAASSSARGQCSIPRGTTNNSPGPSFTSRSRS